MRAVQWDPKTAEGRGVRHNCGRMDTGPSREEEVSHSLLVDNHDTTED